RVLRQLRGRAVRHFDKPQVYAAVEELCREGGGARGRVEADREPAAVRPGTVEKLRDGLYGQLRVHRDHLGPETAHHGDRGEIARRIVGQLPERDEIDAHAGRVGEEQRVAVGLRARDRLM